MQHRTFTIIFVSAGLSQIWKRIWRENKSKHQLPVLCTYQKQYLDRHHTKRQMGRHNNTLLCLLWIRSVTVNHESCWKAQREHSTIKCFWLLQIRRLTAHFDLFYNLKDEALEAILTFLRKLLSHTYLVIAVVMKMSNSPCHCSNLRYFHNEIPPSVQWTD